MAVDSHKACAEAVDRLVSAHDEPVGSIDELSGLEDPYAVQAAVVARLAERSDAVACGYKLSFTVADPPATGLAATPAYGRLLTSHLRPSGATLPAAGEPLVECEVMVRPRRDLTADRTAETTDAELAGVLDACAMLEVPVSRFRSWWPEGGGPRLSAAEFVADNCLAAYVVTGGPWITLTDVDLSAATVELTTPDQGTVRGTARAVMGHPLAAVRWLVGRVGTLSAGTLVATGTMGPAIRAVPGTYAAGFSPPFGDVAVTFAAGR